MTYTYEQKAFNREKDEEMFRANGGAAFVEEKYRTNYFKVETEYPELTGSEKQIAWAEQIRDRKITDQIEALRDKISGMVLHNDTTHYYDEALSRAGVNNTNNLINYILNTVDGAYLKYKNITSAAEIIDNR